MVVNEEVFQNSNIYKIKQSDNNNLILLQICFI